jgi:hypothetical protein
MGIIVMSVQGVMESDIAAVPSRRFRMAGEADRKADAEKEMVEIIEEPAIWNCVNTCIISRVD